MPRKLDRKISREETPELERAKEALFRMCFTEKLTNNYEVKDMHERDNKAFQKFLEDTVYKKLTISQVDDLYLRKQGLGDAPPVKYGDMELLHYGKANSSFRLFGYYNKDRYFVICRIDGQHKTHRT